MSEDRDLDQLQDLSNQTARLGDIETVISDCAPMTDGNIIDLKLPNDCVTF